MIASVPSVLKRNDVRVGYAYIIFSFTILGVGVPISKDAVAVVPVWLFTAITLAIGCAMMLPLASLIDRVRWRRVSRESYAKMALQAFIAGILYTTFLLYGLQNATAVAAGIINSITPALVLVLSVILFKERLTARKCVAILLAAAAVALMSTSATVQGGVQTNLLGAVLVLFSVLSLAVFLVFAKRLATELAPTTLTAGLLALAFLMSLPMALVDARTFSWSAITIKCWYEIVYYGIAVWALPFWTTFLGISRVPASAAGMATALTPVAAIATAIAFYGERLTWQAGVALLLVIVSIAVAEVHDEPVPGTPSVLHS